MPSKMPEFATLCMPDCEADCEKYPEPHNCYCHIGNNYPRKPMNHHTNLIAAAANPNAPKAPDGLQSDLQHRFDLIDGAAMFEMTNVLYKGAKKYGENNWRQLPVEDHLNHLTAHVYAWLAGNRDDKHLVNIMCRAMFALGVDLQGGPTPPF